MIFQKKTTHLAVLLVSLLLPWTVSAQQAISSAVPALPVSPISLGGMFQVLFGLLLVLAAVAAAAWLLRRYAMGQNVMGGAVRVVGGVALGQRERLVLVEVGETWLLLGVAPGQVTALHTMARPEDAPEPAAQPSVASFPAWLKQAVHKRADS